MEFHFSDGSGRSPIFSGRPIASSGFLMKDTQMFPHWRTFARDLAEVEMELSGVYHAARRRAKEYPLLAIRGISDVVGFNATPPGQHTHVNLQQRFLSLWLE